MAVRFIPKLLLLTAIIYSLTNAVLSKRLIKPRIVNGHDVVRGQIPYAAVLKTRENPTFFCGASIISNWHLISVAHCTATFQWRLHDLVVGYDAWDINEPIHYVNVSKIRDHPDFHISSFRNDISIIRTAEEIIFTEYVRLIPLSIQDLPERRDFQARVAGWGVLTVRIDSFKEFFQFS